MTHPALTKRILDLVKDKRRIEFLIKLLQSSEYVTIHEFPEGFRLYTDRVGTRICDDVREAIDSAMGDEQFAVTNKQV